MIALSWLLRRAMYPAMSAAGVFQRRMRAGSVGVLTYHGVRADGAFAGTSPVEGTLVDAKQFRRQIRFLKSRYQLIRPEDFRAWIERDAVLPERAVLITCDDGLLNVLTNMVPILVEEGTSCLFFVTGASLEVPPRWLWYADLYCMLENVAPGVTANAGGKTGLRGALSSSDLQRCWWDMVGELSELSSEDRGIALAELGTAWKLSSSRELYDPKNIVAQRRVMNRDELAEIVAQGMTVGAHTLSHPLLSRMPQELAEREIRECRVVLASELNEDVWAFAYPFGNEGSAGAREMKIVEAAGYSCAFKNHGGGLIGSREGRFGFPRAHVSTEMDLPELEAHLSGFHESLQRGFHNRASDDLPESES